MPKSSVFSSLSFRLTLAFLLTTIVGVILVAILAYRSTYNEFSTFLNHIRAMEQMMGGGMMGGGWGNYNPNTNAKPITIDQAADAVQGYLNVYYGGRVTLTEVIDFAWNYYAEVKEKDTGIHAIELLIDKYTGRVSPEMGPNMMWNTKYSPMGGMMGNYGGGSPTANMPVSADRAKTLAQQYLDTNLPGLTVAEADTFYGYYTLHTLQNGQVEGMLSINGYTGAVWYHTWHGPFLGMKEYE